MFCFVLFKKYVRNKFQTLLLGLFLIVCSAGTLQHPRFQSLLTGQWIIPRESIRPSTVFNGLNFRVFMFQSGIDLWKKAPIIGLGIGDCQNQLNKEIKTRNLYLGDSQEEGFWNYNFHNQYIQTLCEMGIIGLCLLLFIFGGLGLWASQQNNKLLLSILFVFSIAFCSESYLNRQMGVLAFLSFLTLSLQGQKITSYNLHLHTKRLLDIFISLGVILFVLSWLIPLVFFLLILTGQRQLLFVQKRMGKDSIIFNCLKICTIIHKNGQAHISPFCHLLRKFGIDELLQFFNVLKGDMSIVGPRPLMLTEETKFRDKIPNFPERLRLKPGITGLAQSLGRKGTTTDISQIVVRWELDMYYQKHFSIKMDWKILSKTIKSMYLKPSK